MHQQNEQISKKFYHSPIDDVNLYYLAMTLSIMVIDHVPIDYAY